MLFMTAKEGPFSPAKGGGKEEMNPGWNTMVMEGEGQKVGLQIVGHVTLNWKVQCTCELYHSLQIIKCNTNN